MRTLKMLPIVVALMLTACSSRVAPKGSTPGRAGTPIENALAYNASLADANSSLATMAIDANKAGLISVSATSNLTSVQFTVAEADRQITNMLDAVAKCLTSTPAIGAATCKGNAAQLSTLVDRIETNVAALTSSGDLGIKDAKTQQSVDGSLKTIDQMAQLILKVLQTGGLIQ
jgi:hypothetical protein